MMKGALGGILLLVWLTGSSGVAWCDLSRPPRIVVVLGSTEAPYLQVLEGFRGGLPGAAVEVTSLDSADKMLDQHLARFDMVFAIGSQALEAVRRQGAAVPVVAAMVLDERNFQGLQATGVYLDFPFEVQMQWLRRFLPGVQRIGFLYNPLENEDKFLAARKAAERLDFILVARPVSHPREIPAALDYLEKHAEVFWSVADRMVLNPQTARTILLFSFRNRIPLVGLSSAWVRAGALYALDRDYPDIGLQSAELAQEMLAGKKLEDLPPRPPRRVLYTLNLKAAEKIRIDIPQELRDHAAEVY